jgi:hypothetical protein
MGDLPRTEVRENARWELLRCLALIRDEFPKLKLDGTMHVPLYEGEWQNSKDDIWLAAQEAGKLGDIEFHDLNRSTDPATRFIVRTLRDGRDAMVRITDQGYGVVKAHDLLGEVAQDARGSAPQEGPPHGPA